MVRDAAAWAAQELMLEWRERTTFEPSEGYLCDECGCVVAPIARNPVTRGEIEAKRAELAGAGLPSGIEHLARALAVSQSTIRRRLGLLK